MPLIRKEHIINVSLLVVVCVLGLGALELTARYLDRPKAGQEFENIADLRAAMRTSGQHKAQSDGSSPFVDIISENPSDKILYELRPNLKTTFTSVPIRTNSFGMRGPEVSKEKPAGTYRIALLGDSFAFGWGVEENETFATVLEKTLNATGSGSKRYEVLNFGVPGYSTFQEVEIFRTKGIEFHPDAVLVYFIDNDFEFPFFIRSIGTNHNFEGLTLMRITNRAFTPQRMDAELRERGLDPNTTLAELDDFLKERGIALYLAINPKRDWQDIRRRLTVLNDHPGIRLVPIGDAYDKVVREQKYTLKDLNLPNDPHPTALGHRLIGELMAPTLLAGSMAATSQ